MTKENIFKSYLEDPLLIEKNYITKEKLDKLKLIEESHVKLIEVIKIAINENVDGQSEGVVSRKLNQYLNK
ncbi:MAG: hypothetical protein IPG01_12725 [Chitinophagaceae bacterium]|nr:hypothetical protein [Chitinophagaceae bacterium]